MPRRLPAFILLAAAVLGFILAAAIGMSRLYSQHRSIHQDFRINLWLVAQAEIELLRFGEAIDRFRVDGTNADSDTLVLRYDIALSRMNVLMEGRESERLRGLPFFKEGIVDAQRRFLALEPSLFGLIEQRAPAGFDRLRASLDEIVKQVRAFSNAALANDLERIESKRDRDRTEFWGISISFGVSLLCGVVFGLFLLHEMRRTVRLLAATQAAEVEISNAKAQLNDAIENIADGFVLYDADDRIQLCNRRFREIYRKVDAHISEGTSFVELCEASAGALFGIAPENRGAWIETQVHRHATLWGSFEYRLDNGTWIRVTERPTREGGCVGIHTDITELKQRSQALAETYNQLRVMLDSISQGVAVFDAEARLLLWNDRLTELLGQPAKLATLGAYIEAFPALAPLRTVFVGEDESGAPPSGRAAAGDQAGEQRYEFSIAEGRQVEIQANAMPNGGFVATLLDISARKRAEEEREKLLNQINQSQKMQAVGTLAGGIAHDFNNILASIMVNAQLAADDLAGTHPASPFLDGILDGTRKAKNLVSQILLFSRQKSSARAPVRIGEIAAEVSELLQHTLPAFIEIQVGQTTERDVVMGDATQLQQVLLNVCVNSGHAIGQKPGQIRIDLSDIEIDENSPEACTALADPDARTTLRSESHDGGRRGKVWVGALQPGPYLRARVSDNGTGMRLEDLTRAFEPFFTTKETGEGTGLGLSVVEGIVIRHGGAIVVESEPEVGTSFSILLPVLENVQPIKKSSSALQGHRGAGQRVLVIDDEAPLVEATVKALERIGYRAVGASSAQEGLRLFRQQPQTWDLVITDMSMPKLTGIAIAREMKKLRGDIPIILCTGFNATVDDATAAENGVAAVLNKPLEVTELGAAISQVFRT